jgi:cell division protein FtsN
MSNTTVEETTKEKTQYYKRIDDLIDDAEIEAEIEAEKKIRLKNTKLLTISFVAVAVLAFLYFGMETTQRTSVPPTEEKLPEVAQNTEAESLPATEASTTSPVIPPVESTSAKPDKTEPVASAPDVKNPAPNKQPVEKVSPAVETAKVEPAKPIKPTPPPAPVKKTPEPAAPTKMASGNIYIQTGAFSVRENAERMAKRLKAKGFESSIVSHSKPVSRHVVYLSGYPDLNSLSAPIQSLQNAGIKNPEQKKNDDGTYTLTLGQFKTTQEAEKFREKLSLNGILAEEKVANVSLLTHFAQVGGYATRKDALKIQKDLESAGFKGSFIR